MTDLPEQPRHSHISEITTGGRGINITIKPRTIWLTVAVVASVLALAYIAAKSLGVLIIFFIGIIFAEGIRPLITWLHRRAHIPRWGGVFLIYIAILLLLIGLGYLLISPIVAQVNTFAKNLPQYTAHAQQLLNQLSHPGGNSQFAGIIGGLESQLGGLAGALVPLLVKIPTLIGEFAVGIVVIIAVAFFWLTGIDHLKPFVVSLFPEVYQERVSGVFSEMGWRIGGYVRGVVFNMFVIGILSGLGDWLLGVPYPTLLGILAGLTEVIPYFGPWISGGAALVVALLAVGPLKAAEVIGLYIVIQQVEGNTVVPLVMNRAVDLNPLTVIFVVLIGTSVLGIVGGVISVPIAAMVKVLLMRVLAPAARNAAKHASRESDPMPPPPAPPPP